MPFQPDDNNADHNRKDSEDQGPDQKPRPMTMSFLPLCFEP